MPLYVFLNWFPLEQSVVSNLFFLVIKKDAIQKIYGWIEGKLQQHIWCFQNYQQLIIEVIYICEIFLCNLVSSEKLVSFTCPHSKSFLTPHWVSETHKKPEKIIVPHSL